MVFHPARPVTELVSFTTVTQLQEHIHAFIMRKLEQGGSAHAAFLFKAIGTGLRTLAVPQADLLGTPWERVGHAPMPMDT